MRERWPISQLALLAVMADSSLEAGRPVQPAHDHAPVFSSGAELVVVHVTVTDRRGAYVTGLTREAFRRVEDGTLPRTGPSDGGFPQIRVTVSDPARRSLVVRARDGYRAGGPHVR